MSLSAKSIPKSDSRDIEEMPKTASNRYPVSPYAFAELFTDTNICGSELKRRKIC